MSRNSKLRRCILAGIVCATAAGGVSWLLTSEISPLHEYFLQHTGVKNFWYVLNAAPYIISGIIAGNPHTPSEAIYWGLFLIQWFAIGFLIAYLILSIRDRSSPRTY